MASKWGFGKKGKKKEQDSGEGQETNIVEVTAIMERRRVLVLGRGHAGPVWIARLKSAGVEFLVSTETSVEEMARTEFEIIIETRVVESGSDLPEDEADSNSFPALVPGGVILIPCHAVSPTNGAVALGELAKNAIGYTLYHPPGETLIVPAIEIARPMQCDDEVWEWGLALIEEMGLKPEVVGDAPGLVFFRVLACLINEAASALSEGIASAPDIDAAMRLGVNYPKGLFAWADELGLDLIIEILEGLLAHYEEDRYRPSPLLRHMLAAGKKFNPKPQVP